jgi:hypothetical protein
MFIEVLQTFYASTDISLLKLSMLFTPDMLKANSPPHTCGIPFLKNQKPEHLITLPWPLGVPVCMCVCVCVKEDKMLAHKQQKMCHLLILLYNSDSEKLLPTHTENEVRNNNEIC